MHRPTLTEDEKRSQQLVNAGTWRPPIYEGIHPSLPDTNPPK